MKFFIRTLGCKMNQLDSARVRAALLRAGHVPAQSEAEAEYVLVNSCTVTAEADRKSRKTVNGAVRARKQVAVMGCGPRADPERWQTQASDCRIFETEGELLAHFGVAEDEPPFPVISRTRLPVAIQSGCDDVCSFCITRVARGAHRSEPLSRIVRQVRDAEERGLKEVVLTGINVGAWGCRDSRQPRQSRLPEVLAAILGQTAISRVRISSLGPQYLGEEFFDVFADPRICDHLHLSVQSGSGQVLQWMRRGHGAEEVYRVADRARKARPHVALTADFIAGFPGETEEHHRETLTMVQALGLAKLHVFPFSPRAGTPAASLSDQVPGPEKKRRAMEVRMAGRLTRAAFLRSQLGRMASVLVETHDSGLTGNYIRLRVPGGIEGEIQTLAIRRELIIDQD